MQTVSLGFTEGIALWKAWMVPIGLVVLIWGLRKVVLTNIVTTAALRAVRIGGAIPEHVAFIMDGNRRWARRAGLPASKGHPHGGERLIDSLQWCWDAGIRTMTVFAFSIENFKRSQHEVNELMQLAKDLVQKFSDQSDVIHERRVRIRILGDMTLIDPSLAQIFSRVMMETDCYDDGPTLNICFAYASRYDIASAVRDIVQLCGEGLLRLEDVDQDVIAACLATGFGKGASATRKSYPDLVVRTSGETRLSDFLLWEATDSVLSFYPVLWPDFSAWDLIYILLDYQRVCRTRRLHFPTYDSEKTNCTDVGKSARDQRCRQVADAIMHIRCQYFAEINKRVKEGDNS